jgi:hypothetical protein
MAQTIRLGASHKLLRRVQQTCVLSKELLDRPQIRIGFPALHEEQRLFSSLFTVLALAH